VAAARAAHAVALVLRRVRLERRKLRHLVAKGMRIGRLRQHQRAALAVLREEVDEVVDLLGREQHAVAPTMVRLTTTTALALLLLVLASRTRAWRVTRRWEVGVAGVAADLVCQHRELLLDRRDPRVPRGQLHLQLGDHLVLQDQLHLELGDAIVRFQRPT
jgi:hypothetical protein